jgi:hypothetical protein
MLKIQKRLAISRAFLCISGKYFTAVSGVKCRIGFEAGIHSFFFLFPFSFVLFTWLQSKAEALLFTFYFVLFTFYLVAARSRDITIYFLLFTFYFLLCTCHHWLH